MFKNLTFILALLIVLLATPFIAVPTAWKNPIIIVMAASIAIVSYRERHAKRRVLSGGKKLRKTTSTPHETHEEHVEAAASLVPPTAV